MRPPELTGTFIVKGTFRLVRDGDAVPHEEPNQLEGDTPYDEGPDDVLRYESDIVPFKPAADLMLVGTCRAPAGRPVTARQLSFRVGAFTKTLVAIGDRSWGQSGRGGAPTAPQPFDAMPVGFHRAFGGPKHKWHAGGQGCGTPSLPNIEDPTNLVTSVSDAHKPAGFGPMPKASPERVANAGSYRGDWLKTRWPWPAEDFDWSRYNAAPRDQRIETFLVGDETISISGFSADVDNYSSRLPAIRPQVFFFEQIDGRSIARGVLLSLDTLWVDADAEKLVLVWRGLAPVRSLKLKEIVELHVVSRPLSQPPLTPEEYVAQLERDRAVIAQAADREKEKEAAEARLEAEEERAFDDEMARHEKEAEERFADAAARAVKMGAVLPGAKPADSVAEALKFIKAQYPADDPLTEPAFRGLEKEIRELVAEMGAGDETVWTRELCAAHAADKGSFADADLAGLDLSELDFSGLDMSRAVLTKANFSKAKLAGTNLSESSGDSTSFAAADCAGANLANARLNQPDFDSAMLEASNFDGATLREASFVGASLREAHGDGSDFAGADFTGANCAGSKFVDARFSGSKLKKADFSSASLVSCAFESCLGAGINMEAAEITGLRAGGADFVDGRFRDTKADGSLWEGANLDRADFRCADLPRADFTGASLRGARLDAADLTKACFEEANLEDATLTLANGLRASFERASMLRANLQEANLYEAEFWDAKLEKADLRGANVKMTKLA
ncbi:MAG: DUF2169 domain-containing protein [bacterium]